MTVTADEKAQLSDAMVGDAPRLGEALLFARAGWHPSCMSPLELAIRNDKAKPIGLGDAATFGAELKALLEHVVFRLELGVGEAWMSPYTYFQRTPPNFAAAKSDAEREAMATELKTYITNLNTLWQQPEEKWARALVETFVFVMYGGPDILYSRPVKKGGLFVKDKDFYEAFPKYYPLAVACQHLTTFAVLSRGKTVADVTSGDVVGLNCNGASALMPAFTKGYKFATKGECGTTSCIRGHVAPGDALFFNFRGPDATSQLPTLTDEDRAKGIKSSGTVHAATVLRIWGKEVQYFDTGVLVSDGVTDAGEGGTTDHEWAKETIGPYGDAVGLGILGEALGDVDELVKKLDRARPIAVARLVVLDEKGRTVGNGTQLFRVRYVSRLLHLVLGDKGLHLSKLIWAVRNPPTKEGVRLAWWVYLPKGELAKRFVADDAPSKKVADLLANMHPQDSLYQCNIVMGEPNGTATVYRWFEAKGKNGDERGWSKNFDKSGGGLPYHQMPWMALRPPGTKMPDRKLPAISYQDWSIQRTSRGTAYRVVDPAGLAGEETNEEVGVPYFDQGM